MSKNLTNFIEKKKYCNFSITCMHLQFGLKWVWTSCFYIAHDFFWFEWSGCNMGTRRDNCYNLKVGTSKNMIVDDKKDEQLIFGWAMICKFQTYEMHAYQICMTIINKWTSNPNMKKVTKVESHTYLKAKIISLS